MHRPFRFGLQAFEGATADDWWSTVAKTEALGYSTLFTSDHYFGPGRISESTGHRPVDMAPLVSIAMAAAVTSTLRIGCRVFACDYHHPVVLAKETATLDLLSNGRLEVGLGAGWVRDEYDGLGIPMDSAGRRIARLAAFVDLLRAHWSGDQIEIDNDFVHVHGFAGRPWPAQPGGPPIMIGGGAPKVLGLAGRVADIVSLNFDNSSGRLGASSILSSGADATQQKLQWIRDGAGDRFDDIEIEIGAYFVAVGPSASDQLDSMAARFGVTADEFASHPHALFGTVDQICETLHTRRERFGISYVTVAQRHLAEFAPVVEALAGR
ncbi:MAG TPA: TIGR03621 family F420-dependent LLM class oxidoreductase [Acidimicrobiales bacterium]|nr:TIGR03621 family F420-dependent LLM class oxidoreductase [Acidimicrobiales bacterium]